jgi:hypothetical protein
VAAVAYDEFLPLKPVNLLFSLDSDIVVALLFCILYILSGSRRGKPSMEVPPSFHEV